MPKILRLTVAAILLSAGGFAAMNAADIRTFVYKKGLEYHGGMIVQYREFIRRKFDELTVRLQEGHNQPDRSKLLSQYIFVCEQILPFDEPRKSACEHNINVFLGDGCIRQVHLNDLSDEELHAYLTDRFQMSIVTYGDFMGAMNVRLKDLYHAYHLSWYMAQLAPTQESRERHALTSRLMKETYKEDRELLKKYQDKSLTLEEYKKQVIDFKIDIMKQTPDWKRGCWKGYIVPGKDG